MDRSVLTFNFDQILRFAKPAVYLGQKLFRFHAECLCNPGAASSDAAIELRLLGTALTQEHRLISSIQACCNIDKIDWCINDDDFTFTNHAFHKMTEPEFI